MDYSTLKATCKVTAKCPYCKFLCWKEVNAPRFVVTKSSKCRHCEGLTTGLKQMVFLNDGEYKRRAKARWVKTRLTSL